MKLRYFLAAGAAVLTMAGTARASVITFDAFSIGNFSGGQEAGYTIAANSTSVWGGVFGFPTNSIGAATANTTGTVAFTDGGLFTFAGLDLVQPNLDGSVGPVSVSGYLGGNLVATDIFPTPATRATPFSFVATNLLEASIDELVISYTSNATHTPLVDNVVLNAVPEPSTLALAFLGAVAAGLSRRRASACCSAG